jgi:hypothetical protein
MTMRPILFGGKILIKYYPMTVPYEPPQTVTIQRRQYIRSERSMAHSQLIGLSSPSMTRER